MNHLMHQIQSHLLGGKKKGNPLRTIFVLVLFCFYQSAYAASIEAWDTARTVHTVCSIGEPTITSTKNKDGSVEYQFTHPIQITEEDFFETYRTMSPRCRFQISHKTQSSNLLGGWKLTKAPQDTDMSTNDPVASHGSRCGRHGVGTDWPIDGSSPIWGANQQTVYFEYWTQNSGCKLSYSFTLIKDSEASGGTNKLCPLINFNTEDMKERVGFYAASLNTQFTTCAVPDVAPPPPICKPRTPSKVSQNSLALYGKVT